MPDEATANEIREAVRERYGSAARGVQSQQATGCCSGPTVSESKLYELSQIQELPDKAVLASLGCGNPTLLAELKPGETVLDLGSGGGIDVLLSAKRVGPTGKAYGLDMTDEMLELARANAKQAGATNVEFLKGQIESIPLPDESVDVIISNCVINLSADKDAVLREAFRVLKPGGRFAVADIVVQGGPLPELIRKMIALWAGCVAGALTEDEYRAKLASAGFANIDLEVLKVYGLEDVPEEMRCCVPADLSLPGGSRLISAFVRATKARRSDGSTTTRPKIVIGSGSPTTTKISTSACCSGSGSSASGCCGSTVKSYFKDVASRWDTMREGYFTEEVREAAIARAKLTSGSVIADVGTGTGFMCTAECVSSKSRAHQPVRWSIRPSRPMLISTASDFMALMVELPNIPPVTGVRGELQIQAGWHQGWWWSRGGIGGRTARPGTGRAGGRPAVWPRVLPQPPPGDPNSTTNPATLRLTNLRVVSFVPAATPAPVRPMAAQE